MRDREKNPVSCRTACFSESHCHLSSLSSKHRFCEWLVHSYWCRLWISFKQWFISCVGEVRYVYVWGVMIFLIIAQSAVKVPKLRWRSLGVCFLINKTYITYLYLYDKYFSICSVTDMILIVIAAEYLTFF